MPYLIGFQTEIHTTFKSVQEFSDYTNLNDFNGINFNTVNFNFIPSAYR